MEQKLKKYDKLQALTAGWTCSIYVVPSKMAFFVFVSDPESMTRMEQVTFVQMAPCAPVCLLLLGDQDVSGGEERESQWRAVSVDFGICSVPSEIIQNMVQGPGLICQTVR